MARSKVKVVLDRTNFSDEVLKRAVKPVMDDVQEQVEGMAAVDPAIKVYRNERTPTAPTLSPPLRPRSNRPTEC